VNPHVNAIVTLLPEQAMAAAAAADEAQARGVPLGPLHGLPIAHKDLANTKDIRTTFGSPIHADNVPDFNDLIIERLQGAGALTMGKTNTPEFGAGSQTFNRVFGTTRNPYDLSKTCGGSSGGAAVSLATGMMPIADGSDMGGSLRNPANYCNIVGMRVSPGRVPDYPKMLGWGTLAVVGPMARTVSDVALLLTAIAGPDRRDPLSIKEPGSLFARPLERDFRGTKVAWSLDLGELPVDGRVTAVLQSQRHVFTDLGLELAETMPDWSGADEAFKAGRAMAMAHSFAPLLETHRDQLKDTIIWNAESGLKLSALDYARAEAKRTELYHRVREFMEEYEFLILPVSQVPPFDINQPFISKINGVQMDTYIDWMKSCYYISATGLPAISVPCGFTADGLPVGVQIVGRHQDDFGVLQLAYAFEQATQVWRRRPEIGK
jgi:amidase